MTLETTTMQNTNNTPKSEKKKKSKKVKQVADQIADQVKQVADQVAEPVTEPVAEPVVQNTKVQKLKKPKRALTAYNFYSKEQYPVHKGANSELKFGDIQKLISAQWKLMSVEDKTPYMTMHTSDKTRYATELATFDATPPDLKVVPKKKKTKYMGPKRALSAYMFFKQDASAEIKGENKDVSFGDLQKEVGVRWTSLKSSTKKDDIKRLAKYHKQHATDKTRYDKEFAVYNQPQTTEESSEQSSQQPSA